MRLLATFGEKRSERFASTPTLKELGFNLVVEAPNGIGAPAGIPADAEKKLRDAFRTAVNSEEFKAVAARIDSPLMYLDGPDYKKYVMQVYREETDLIRRLNLSELMAKG
jgi:tripartite-type tricarboxylate transporter receptor subunit TctC